MCANASVGEHLAQRRPHRRQRQRVAGERAADAADVDDVGVPGIRAAAIARGDVLGDAVGAARDAAADRLADDEDVGLEAPRARSRRPARRRTCASRRSSAARRTGGQLAQALHGSRARAARCRCWSAPARSGSRRRRRGRAARSTASRSFHSAARVVRSSGTGGADVARPRRALPSGPATRTSRRPSRGSSRRRQDLGPAGDQPGQPDRPAVGVGGRQRERPQRQPEPAGQLGATHSASAVGSIVVMPPRSPIRRATASTVARGSGRPSRRCRRARSRRTRARRRR